MCNERVALCDAIYATCVERTIISASGGAKRMRRVCDTVFCDVSNDPIASPRDDRAPAAVSASTLRTCEPPSRAEKLRIAPPRFFAAQQSPAITPAAWREGEERW